MAPCILYKVLVVTEVHSQYTEKHKMGSHDVLSVYRTLPLGPERHKFATAHSPILPVTARVC
jgi:hypothetical protein